MTCSTTSNGLTGFIEGLGGRHLRFKKGYRNVIGKGMELDAQGIDAQLMMETRCGGFVFMDTVYPLCCASIS